MWPICGRFSSPTPSFLVAPLQGGACVLVRTRNEAWLFNTGRESATPSTVWHLLQFYGINQLDGLVLAQMSGVDNGGAAMIARDFHPQRLVLPLLRTRSPLEKTMPEIAALAGRSPEPWRRGEDFALGRRRSGSEVLHPGARQRAQSQRRMTGRW